jgi:hypothetical protein
LLTIEVFLRALEYYTGIIFLTTNRIQDFDMAVIDRTLLVVPFVPLDAGQRCKVRENVTTRAKAKEAIAIDQTADAVFKTIDHDEYDWNGREIVQGE